ncbi:phosphotransferase KptA/Tpt1 [Saccharata proteae CBS 121410]|uniref:2'-phosphotransferase n=1 Tax=Saccharata proteae CBS 121410 TaxID=1314787 RepID=A0A9P4I0Y9_9PEZI|nr:phosphotransferase KptA/Tpt1 [Saccharata proteae CBS 121410]
MGRRGGRGGGPMPRDVQVSKKLSRLLRHSAAEEGLVLGPGGYVNLGDVLNTKQLKSLKVSFAEVRDIVRDNEKQRFSLIPVGSAPQAENAGEAQDASTTTGDATLTNESEDPAQYLIRANQGHSIAVETDGLLNPITAEDIPATCVHGTTNQAWPLILRSGGLKKMNRTHIHFAAGLPSGFKSVEDTPASAEGTASAPVISGMRNSSTILIYVDVGRAMDAGIAFFRSENGVILSAGGEDDVLPMTFFSKVEDRKRGRVLVKDGKLVEGAANTKE